MVGEEVHVQIAVALEPVLALLDRERSDQPKAAVAAQGWRGGVNETIGPVGICVETNGVPPSNDAWCQYPWHGFSDELYALRIRRMCRVCWTVCDIDSPAGHATAERQVVIAL